MIPERLANMTAEEWLVHTSSPLERLIVIMQEQYPYSFNLWLEQQIGTLKEFARKNVHRRGIYADVQYFVELRPSFESAEGYNEARDIIEWI